MLAGGGAERGQAGLRSCLTGRHRAALERRLARVKLVGGKPYVGRRARAVALELGPVRRQGAARPRLEVLAQLVGFARAAAATAAGAATAPASPATAAA